MDLRLPEPEASGFADVTGVQIAWQSFGQGESAVLVVPTWNFVDSRVSAHLVPDLSRSFRVVTFDPRGAGRSDRPKTGYRFDDHLADAVAVLQAAG
ncbi:MAG: alpha/beta fold hydrolase, partial [Chloroflexota bacterium]